VVRGPRIERVSSSVVDAQAQPRADDVTVDVAAALPRGPRTRRGGLRLARREARFRSAGMALDGPTTRRGADRLRRASVAHDHEGNFTERRWARLGRSPLVAGMAISLA
jgi:hypothetical protein